MKYQIIRGDAASLNTAVEAKICDVPWGSTYTPDSRFKGIFMEGKGFLFQLSCYESNPRREHKNPGEEVCEDSCLEIFLNFAPDKSTSYINFEMNAGGAWLFGIGPDRYQRTDLSHTAPFQVEAERFEEYWQVTLTVPKAAIEALYGKLELVPGYLLTGNVYKCGDLTDEPHYLSWSDMNPKVLDFHRSDRFGTFELV